MAPAKVFSHEFCEVFKNTYLSTDASESVSYEVYILLSESLLEEEKEYKTEDNPWVFRRVICTCEQQYCKIITNMRCTLKENLVTKIFHVDSFGAL